MELGFAAGMSDGFFLRLCGRFQGLKVWKAAGVLLIVTGSDEHGLVELVVAKLLKGDGGCDRGENGDVCGEKRTFCVYTYTRTLESAVSSPSLTGKPGGSFI